REIIEALVLEEQGPIRATGHDAVRLRGTFRPGGRLWPHVFPPAADEYELHALPERGVLLAIIARLEGAVTETSEVTALAFDEALDDTLFGYEPAPGEAVRPADPITVMMALDEAAVAMPFAVLVPAHLPPGTALDRIVHHLTSPQRWREDLTLFFDSAE